MAKYKTDHTHIMASDPHRVIEFYTKVMGGKAVRESLLGGTHRAWDIDLGGLLLRVSDWSNVDEALETDYAEARGKQRFGVHHLGLMVDDLDEACAELKENGAEFALAPKTTGPNSRVAFVVAPENVLIELIERR